MSNNPKHKNIEVKCFAKTRKQTLCQTPPVKGKKRCRMHGGAIGTGAPFNNRNALKHGYYGTDSIQRRRESSQLLKQVKTMLKELR